MNIEEVRDYCLSLPHTSEDMPFGEDVLVFRVGGKIFLMMWLGTGGHYGSSATIALKLPPELGLELRDKYDAVTPAWHMNKKHWNDIDITPFASEQITQWIDISYNLVARKHRNGLKEIKGN